jgi:hypothetical protein
MTDKPSPLPSTAAVPAQAATAPEEPIVKDEIQHKAELVEEEPYTIKCICDFRGDDGNTIYCETCDTWQHIECFYPDNREEAIREDFAHSCADCQPRSLNQQKALERTARLKTVAFQETDKKTKRPPSKSHKKKTKPIELHINGANGITENGKPIISGDHPPPAKKVKSSHRPSQSISSQPAKRSPSYNARTVPTHPISPATTPPDLPNDFTIHHYSAGFYSLYDEHDVPDAHDNTYASLKIPTALTTWVRNPDTMKQEVGHTPAEVFQKELDNDEQHRPVLEVKDATSSSVPGPILKWRFLQATTSIEKDIPLIELNGEIGFQKDYCAEPDNLWGDLSSPLPFVFFHPVLPLYIDTRKEGSLARYVRRSCKPNAQLDTHLSEDTVYHFWLVSDRFIPANEQITLPWDFRLDKTVCPRWLHLLGLQDDDGASHDEPELDDSEYTAISNWIDRILSEYGGCACDLDNNCAFARFHRHYLYSKNYGRPPNPKKRQRKSRTHTISPTSTGHATNSRAASEGKDDSSDRDGQDETASSRSKPPSRERTPQLQGSLDKPGILTEQTDRDKRKVAMVEDSFRRMEQQPPRKKKRISDGTATSSSSTKSKARNGSSTHANYVDIGTSRSKSNSPASSHSPRMQDTDKNQSTPYEREAVSSRQSSTTPRPEYCDASVQTDPVDGEWYSEPAKSCRPKKRIISLATRLLNSRHKLQSQVETRRSSSAQASPTTPMDIDPPLDKEHSSASPTTLEHATAPEVDAVTADESQPSGAVTSSAIKSSQPKLGTLRVQLPPVPAFDSHDSTPSSATTPHSSSTTMVQSPFSASISSPFTPSLNHTATQPSPVKKKLSLSDYTKSRLNKSAGKVVGGTAVLKSGLSNPDELKGEIIVETPVTEKPEEDMAMPNPVPLTNGAA